MDIAYQRQKEVGDEGNAGAIASKGDLGAPRFTR
jgi:hypothetical protein